MLKFVWLLIPAVLAAQDAVRLETLIGEALERNPEVRAARKGYEAARLRPSQAGALPDPMVSLGYQSVGRPWIGAGLGEEPMANAGAMLTQQVPFPGKRGLRTAIAQREAEAERSRWEEVRLGVASRVRQAFFRLAQAYDQIDLLERNRDLLQRFLRISEARYSAGRAAQQDIFRTQTQLSILETRRERMRQEIRAREAELTSLLGREPASPSLGRPQQTPPAPLRTDLTALLAAAQQRAPMLARERSMIQRAELSTGLARREMYPDFAVSGGVYSMGSMGQMYMARLDVSLPLWANRKQRAAIAEQVALERQSRYSYYAAGRTLVARIQEDYAMAETSWRLREMYRGTVIPQSNLALESSLASYETGAVDLLTVLGNFGTTLEYEMNILEEELNYRLALARIEEMTGIDPAAEVRP